MQDQQLMGLLLIPASLLGFLCNWTIFLVASRIKSLNPSFSILVAMLAAADGLGSAIFLFYVSPMIVLDLKTWKEYSYHCGFLIMIAYDTYMNAHILIVLNRFLAVFTPIAYKTVFSVRATKLLVALSILISLSTITTFFGIFGCHLFYNNDLWMFYYTDLPICWWYAYNLDMNKVLSIAILGVLINTIVLLKVKRTRKKVNRGQGSMVHKKREMAFLKQTVGQGVYLFVFAIVYCFLPLVVENLIIGFLLTTMFLCCLHTVDGLLVIAFNSEIREAIGLYRKKPAPGSSFFVESRRSFQ